VRAATLAALVLALSATPAGAQTCGAAAGAPAFTPGPTPITDEQVSTYLTQLDAASTRVQTGVAGTSVQGRPLPYAIASSPQNLARLSSIAARARASRRGRSHAAGGPAIVWLAANVHGNEPSGTDADLQLLSELARSSSCDLLDRLVVVFLPLQNPDGRAAGTRVNANGFDLNRDWFAATQPETSAKLALLERYPPVAFADQHEEAGSSFFFPPDRDPVHHEVPAAALRAMSQTIAPALRHAFEQAGLTYMTGAGYDLFFMGYGDSATTTLFGAAGMTFEKGTDAPFEERVAEHHLAAQALLQVVAAHRHALLRAWDRTWRQARAEGRRGRLEPNGLGASVPRARVYAYAWRSDVAQQDAARLVGRLRSVGVRVNRLLRAVTVRFHAYGSTGTRRRQLPASTWVVTLDQTQKHWVEAMLGENAYASVPYFYDVASWSNPLLMGLDGGAIRSRLPRGALGPGAAPTVPDGPPFTGDSEGAAEYALHLLAAGAGLARDPKDGAFEPAGTGGAVDLRVPRVALLDEGMATPSFAWMRWLLEQRYGLAVDLVGSTDLERLAGGGYTAFVVPDGIIPTPSAAGLAALQAWVRGGGTYIGVRGEGIALAQSAGITTATASPPADAQLPGVSLAVQLDPSDPIAWGERSSGFAFATGDPVVYTSGGTVVARYPSGSAFFAGGYAEGTSDLRGTAAVLDEPTGAGRTVLFTFDPVFRGYVEGTERLVANALLAPPTGAPATRARPVRHVRAVTPPFSELP
jgi:Zinc carboxypeptidase